MNSDYFQSLLSNNNKEYIINDNNISFNGFNNLINYLSFQNIEINDNNIIDIMKTCIYYKEEKLYNICKKYVQDNICISLAVDIVKNKIEDLYPLINTILKSYASDIILNITNYNSDVILYVINLDDIIIGSEQIILENLIRFLYSKKDLDFEVFLHIQWDNISNDELNKFINDELINEIYSDKLKIFKKEKFYEDKPFIKHPRIYFSIIILHIIGFTNNQLIDEYYVKCIQTMSLIIDDNDILYLSIMPYIDYFLNQSNIVVLITIHIFYNSIDI